MAQPWDYGPVNLNTTRIPKRPSRSNAALNIRISCVLGSTTRHIKAQSAAISPIRKTNNTMLPTIANIIAHFNKKSQVKIAHFNKKAVLILEKRFLWWCNG
jgi:hypothetical protein